MRVPEANRLAPLMALIPWQWRRRAPVRPRSWRLRNICLAAVRGFGLAIFCYASVAVFWMLVVLLEAMRGC